MVLLCVVFLFWDFLTGYRGWSLEYGIPVVILLVFPVLTVIVKLMKLPASYYMIYYLLACAAGLLQLLFWPAGLVQMHRVCVLCGAVSACFCGAWDFPGEICLGRDEEKDSYVRKNKNVISSTGRKFLISA